MQHLQAGHAGATCPLPCPALVTCAANHEICYGHHHTIIDADVVSWQEVTQALCGQPRIARPAQATFAASLYEWPYAHARV